MAVFKQDAAFRLLNPSERMQTFEDNIGPLADADFGKQCRLAAA